MRKCIQGVIHLPNFGGDGDAQLILDSVRDKFTNIEELTHYSTKSYEGGTSVSYSFKAENMIICKGYEKMLLEHLRDFYGASGIAWRLTGDSINDFDPAINVEL